MGQIPHLLNLACIAINVQNDNNSNNKRTDKQTNKQTRQNNLMTLLLLLILMRIKNVGLRRYSKGHSKMHVIQYQGSRKFIHLKETVD